MLRSLLRIKIAWSDYFTGSPSIIERKEYGKQQTPSNTNVHVSNCLFVSITSSSNGGALSCTSVTLLLVESSSFFSCKTSGNYGGAVYFSNTGGQCVLHQVCGNDCCSTCTSGFTIQFFHSIVNNVISSKNYFNYSSITRCLNENSNSWYAFRLEYGKNCIPSVNISNNRCHGRPVMLCLPTAESNSVTCSLSYCSFADNIATAYGCIFFWATGTKYEIKSCNILRNTQVTNTEGTFYTSGNVMFVDSCIIGNNATCIFYVTSSSTVTLSNCTVDKTSKTGILIIQNTVTRSFIHALNHMSTQNCIAEYDAVGALTPIIQHSSYSKRQRYCYTGDKLFVQFSQGNVILLISLFVFNFIYPYASGYHLIYNHY
jgi:hypothetical protein